jgi:enoyl-CoA hydratase
MSNALTVERGEKILTIRFTRPEIRNPLSIEVLEAINGALDSIDGFDEIIFTGSGGVFASGANLNEISGLAETDVRAFAKRGQDLMNRIASVSAKTSAIVNGPCYGGALDLALACDRRIALPNATFCHPGAGLGIMTGWGGTQRLPRLVGQAKALEMFFTAEPIDAREAMRIGLVDEISAPPTES